MFHLTHEGTEVGEAAHYKGSWQQLLYVGCLTLPIKRNSANLYCFQQVFEIWHRKCPEAKDVLFVHLIKFHSDLAEL